MNDGKLKNILANIYRNERLPRVDVVTGDISDFERQAIASHLVSHNLATPDGNRWKLTTHGLDTLRGKF